MKIYLRILGYLKPHGHIFLAQPPLYRIDAGNETYWAADDSERDKVLAGLAKNLKPEISRFKGLGEMPAQDLKTTTLDPRRRRALKVVIDEAVETDRILHELMGKDPAPRFRYIMEHAPHADAGALDV